MKKKGLLACAFLLAGNAFCFYGCSGTVAEGVVIDGIEVGGMEYAQAVERIRNRIGEELPSLTLETPKGEYTVRYPQLSFQDDLPILVRIAVKDRAYTAKWERTWAELETTVGRICEENAVEAKDASVEFTGENFLYTPERVGITPDYADMVDKVTTALKNGQERVRLTVSENTPAITEAELRKKTQLLATFTTYFDGNNLPRVSNIKLSASRISGKILEAGEEFSFNETVGLRTAENGYQNATVIQNGQFTDGIGGGVCQTSTTLFNCALLAGMEITESRNHSLSIGYVPPSLDAMVSEYSDFKFRNSYSERVYLSAKVAGEGITFSFYGLPSGEHYETESVTIMKMDPPPAQIVYGEEEKVIREEKGGLVSESYRLRYASDGTLLSRDKIRRDSYATVQGIYQIVKE